jgi:hypothetical protein
LQLNIGEKYIAHLNRKIESIIRFAAAKACVCALPSARNSG